MCGIIGYSGTFDRTALLEGDRRQRHRGPDDEGNWFDHDAGIGLAHRRLAIQDLSAAGAQPMSIEDEAIVIVFNGEIYNFRELRSSLEACGHRFRGHSDTEVLLHLYLAYGEEMLSRLNGIFAFALWDRRNMSLLVARDALGVKPLYYAQTSDGFAFASEIKALLPLVPDARALDVAALHRYLSFLWCPGDGTPLRDVRKLAPGAAMVIRDGKIAKRWTWYQLPPFRGVRADLTEGEAIVGTEAALRAAVRRQLVADVPVGAFLSGGLDSSAVVAFARESVPDIRCFTIETTGGAEDGITDDLPFARRVAKHLGVSLDVVTIAADDMVSDLETMVAQLDEPIADPAPLNVLYISRLARRHGMKVLLSGAGGDDLFTGYRRHLALAYERYWRWLPHALRAGLEGATAGLDRRRPLSRRVAKLLSGAGLEGDARLTNYFLWSSDAQLRELYTPEFRAELGSTSAVAPMRDFLAPLPESVSELDRMLLLEQRFFLADHNLMYTDKMSMAAGVEVRVPFLDLDLVDYAARIPTGLKQRGRVGKWVLKKAMEPHLPHDVIYRPKSGFGAPLRRWMRGGLRPLLRDLLSTESLRARGLFEPGSVQRLIEKNESGEQDAAYTLLSLLTIEIWCRANIDAVPAVQPMG